MCLGIPGQVVAIADEPNMLGHVEVAGVRRLTNLACVAEPDQPLRTMIGQWVLVHVGFALSRIDAQEAERTLALLVELGEAQPTLDPPEQPSRD